MDLLNLELKGSMREDLAKALLSAFPKNLAGFVKSALDWELEEFTTGAPFDRVTTLIETAEAKGKVWRLIRRAAWENPGNQKLQQLLKSWGLELAFPVPLLKLLHGILRAAELPMSVLDEVGSEVVEGYTLAWDWELPEELRAIMLLEYLANRPLSGDTSHPLLDFVARLGCRPDAAAIRSQFQDWLQKAGQWARLPNAQVESLWKRAEEEVPGKPLYLLVKIDLQEPDEYLVKAWLSDEQGEDCLVVFGGDGRRHPLIGLDAQVQNILSEVRTFHSKRLLVEAKNELTVEFFLPRTLLCRRLESIPIDAGSLERIPLGIKYGVVVRSAERIDAGPDSQAWYPWCARWKSFRDNPVGRHWILIHTEEDSKRRTLIAQMSTEKDFLLALLLAPQADPRSQKEDLLNTLIIQTGMPIALWLREGAPLEAEVRAEFESLLEKIPELPKQIRAKRLEGFAQDERHLGNRLTLLWDDPERLPLELRETQYLEAPDSQG
ncbi:effector-associated domain EAD1-containing protein [Corallococcus caeni]|uniref:Uncharacterized protein n=1 Tax=Corallococcus caeni TaxID=3082388 RepID=A0ABQ6QN35_9BACT|nr:hypothetical protein ASNO1_16830 [Corallococcus sp. NO1]